MPQIVSRFAPSPTGRLPLGNARTALFAWLYARGAGGRFIVRAEDTDAERSSEESLASQLEDLAWLGVDWDAGPDREDGQGPYRQSRRGATYDALYERLQAGGHLYPCYCSQVELDVSRRAQLAAGRPPRYAGTCRNLDAAARAAHEAAGRRPTLRFRVSPGSRIDFVDGVRGTQSFAGDDIGDFIVRRADGTPAFFFCNAVDDALMGVTDVLRGEDHLTNTPRQLMVLAALGLPAPRYAHLPLLLGGDGAPLSKRHGATSLAYLRATGYLPAAVANHLLRLGHQGAPDGWLEPAELATHFSLARVGHSPARFDPQQLLHWQREAVKRLSPDAALAWLGPALPPGLSAEEGRRLAGLVQHNVLFPDEAAAWAEVLHGTLPLDGIGVSRADLRLQVEQEAMGKLLRLRRGVMVAGADTERQQELLRASLSTLLVIFRAVMRLHGEQPPRDAAQVVAAVSRRCGFDSAPFERVSALKRGTALPAADTERVLEGYVTGMTALVAYLNRFDGVA